MHIGIHTIFRTRTYPLRRNLKVMHETKPAKARDFFRIPGKKYTVSLPGSTNM